MKGIIKSYSPQHGYGFIQAQGKDQDIYFHKKDWQGKNDPAIGNTVDFMWVMSPKGFKAIQVKEITYGK